MDVHKAEILKQKRKTQMRLLSQGLYWISRHEPTMVPLDSTTCDRIAEFIAANGAIRRLIALDDADVVIQQLDDDSDPIITVSEAIRALNQEVAYQWRGRRIPANPTVHANGVREALRRLEERGSEGK